MLPLTDKENESYINKMAIWLICRKEFDCDNDPQIYCTVRDQCYKTGKYCEATHVSVI